MIDLKWLWTCVTAGEFLYGEFPMDVLLKMYATKGGKITKEEVMEYHDSSLMMLYDGENFTPQIVTSGKLLKQLKDLDAAGNPYASLHFDPDELQDLRKENAVIGNLPYWIPTAPQIEELMEKGCISSPAMKRMEEKVRGVGEDPSYLAGVWMKVSAGKLDMMEETSAVLRGMYPGMVAPEEAEKLAPEIASKAPELDDLNDVIPLVDDFLNNINMRDRKGWPPAELSKRMPKHQGMPIIMPASTLSARTLREAEPELWAMGAKVDYSSIDNFVTVGKYGERKVVKVGRNDLCPCGSGRKYKKCHGR